jgi:glycosyltransferase involved in cell wall biosynthesis
MSSTVSAIISAYNAERFLAGRLDDLMAQSLFTQGRLQVIICNAGSTDGTGRIIREYMQRIPLTVITSLRDCIYTSWNRCIGMATGDYITNANCDDRLRPDALEVLANALDEGAGYAGLVYADAYVTDTSNAAWDGEYNICKKPPYTSGKLAWPDFDPLLLTKLCFTGNCPMWSRSLHKQYGMFDETFLLAGDYEWSLRLVANGVTFEHIPETLGLFYNDGAGINNPEQSAVESRRAILEHKRSIEAKWAT